MAGSVRGRSFQILQASILACDGFGEPIDFRGEPFEVAFQFIKAGTRFDRCGFSRLNQHFQRPHHVILSSAIHGLLDDNTCWSSRTRWHGSQDGRFRWWRSGWLNDNRSSCTIACDIRDHHAGRMRKSGYRLRLNQDGICYSVLRCEVRAGCLGNKQTSNGFAQCPATFLKTGPRLTAGRAARLAQSPARSDFRNARWHAKGRRLATWQTRDTPRRRAGLPQRQFDIRLQAAETLLPALDFLSQAGCPRDAPFRFGLQQCLRQRDGSGEEDEATHGSGLKEGRGVECLGVGQAASGSFLSDSLFVTLLSRESGWSEEFTL